MPIVVTLKITESQLTFAQNINIEIAKQINRKRPLILSKLYKNIHALAIRTLEQTPEFESISNPNFADSLKALFGFTDNKSSEISTQLPRIIADTLEINGTSFIGTSTGIKGRWEINMIPADYGTWLLTEEIAHYQSVTKGGKASTEVPWLDWLLRQGDKFVVNDYDLEFGNHPGSISRSGKALMILEKGTTWSVPGAISGTVNNNWLTRTFRDDLSFTKEMESLIKFTFSEVL